MIVISFLVEEDVVFLSRVSYGVAEDARGSSESKYIVVFLEELRGFGSCFFVLGFVPNNTCVIDSQVDLSWCSHGVVCFAQSCCSPLAETRGCCLSAYLSKTLRNTGKALDRENRI
jgi:hypothetical protein